MYRLILMAVLLFAAAPVMASIAIPSDGSDGAFAPAEDIEVDLALAAQGAWNTPGGGNGVYDPEEWAVVFKFTSVTIPEGVTVTFRNHPSRAPVVWLVQGSVTIDGEVNLDGEPSAETSGALGVAEPGPGGFRGGRGESANQPRSSGYGIGGGGHGSFTRGAGGSYATTGGDSSGPLYGNLRVFPLIGGSGGGGGGSAVRTGGAGGGAILIAAANEVSIEGVVSARGGNGSGGGSSAAASGSGGGIRIVADTISGVAGSLDAIGGTSGQSGGEGRIALEANTISLADTGSPEYIAVPLEEPVVLFRADAPVPSIEITAIGELSAPTDPLASLTGFNTDVFLEEAGVYTVTMTANQVPGTATVTLRLTTVTGEHVLVEADFQSGDLSESIWQAEIDASEGVTALQAHAVLD